MNNAYNQTSVLNLEFQSSHEKTVLKDYYFTSPFKVLPAFETENGFARAMIMSSSGGILEGDIQEIFIGVGENCRSEIISQSYEKIHKMETGFGARHTNIQIAANSTLHFTPLPTIPFAGSRFKSTTDIHLADHSSRLIYNEIISAGRVHFGEVFQFESYDTLTTISQDGKKIYRDFAHFQPDQMDMTGFLLFQNYTHMLSQVLCNFSVNIKELRQMIEDLHLDISFGVTTLEHGAIAIRALGHQGSVMEQLSTAVAQYIQ